MLLKLAKMNREATSKGKDAELKRDLEQKIERFDKLNAAKALNKHGLMNRLHIDKDKHAKLSAYLKEQQINKQLVQECTPIEIRKIVAESDAAYAKLLEINNNIEGTDYGTGVYFNQPDIARGAQRLE